MKRLIMVLAAVLLIAGCSFTDMLRATIAGDGAEAANAALETSVWGVCTLATTGAVERRYTTESQHSIWESYCEMERAKGGT